MNTDKLIMKALNLDSLILERSYAILGRGRRAIRVSFPSYPKLYKAPPEPDSIIDLGEWREEWKHYHQDYNARVTKWHMDVLAMLRIAADRLDEVLPVDVMEVKLKGQKYAYPLP